MSDLFGFGPKTAETLLHVANRTQRADNYTRTGPVGRLPVSQVFLGSKWIRFQCNADFTTSDETFQARIALQSDSDNPSTDPQTIYNLPASTGGYVFEGKTDYYGLAQWTSTLSQWHLWQLECEPAPPPTGFIPEV